MQHFHYIVSLASLAYTFTLLHAIQYAMQDHDDDSITQNTQDYDSTHHSASSSTPNTLATTSTTGIAEKTTGQWTDEEVMLLLNYVEQNSTLTTARGLNLKKSEFNKAREVVESKDAAQCRYKWKHVRFFYQRILQLLIYHHSYVQSTRLFRSGTRNPAVAGTMITASMHEPRAKNRCLKTG